MKIKPHHTLLLRQKKERERKERNTSTLLRQSYCKKRTVLHVETNKKQKQKTKRREDHTSTITST